MGMSFFGSNSSSTYDAPKPTVRTGFIPTPVLPNPNPRCYSILRHEQVGGWLVVLLEYPDCTNYEGQKIVVYADCGLVALKEQGKKVGIDPHFSSSLTMHTPFARFEPTEAGWTAALATARRGNVG